VTYSAEVLADSPYLYWRLGEPSGSVANDSSGNGRHGTIAGAPTFGVDGALVGDSNDAMGFGGTNETITFADTNDLVSFSIEAWVKTLVSGEMIIASRYPSASTDQHFYFYKQSNNRIGAILRTPLGGTFMTPGTADAPALNDGNWHHVVVTLVNGGGTGNCKLYCDGELVSINDRTGSFTLTNVPFIVGGRDSDALSRWNGSLDEIAYYNSALSPKRVVQHYDAGRAEKGWAGEVIDDAPLIFWRLNEVSGNNWDWSGNNRNTSSVVNLLRQQAGLLGTTHAIAPSGTTTAGGSHADHVDLDVTAVTLEVVFKATLPGVIQWIGGKSGSTAGLQSIQARINAAGVLQIGLRTDTMGSLVNNEYTLGTTADYADGNWHHLVATWSPVSDTLRLYLDGLEVQSWSVTGNSMYNGTGTVFYGSAAPAGRCVAGIDEFVYYGSELSAERIYQHAVELGLQDPIVPTGTTVTVWDGVSEIPADVTVWDGSTELPTTLEIA
jgi:hypothetical protein